MMLCGWLVVGPGMDQQSIFINDVINQSVVAKQCGRV
jgi:hypothetical protein